MASASVAPASTPRSASAADAEVVEADPPEPSPNRENPRSEPRANVRRLLHDGAALVSWMRARDASLAASAARVRQAEAAVGTSRLVPNPVVDASLSDVVVGPTNPPGLRFGDTAIYSAGVSQTIEIGKRGPRARAAELRLDSVRLVSTSELAFRVAEARLALGRVVYATAKQAILGEQLGSAQEVAALEQVRMQQGALSGNDYDRLLLETMSLELEVERNRAAMKGAAAACRAVLFAVCDGDGASLADLDTALPMPIAVGDSAQALARRADIRAISLDRDAARQDAQLAARRAIPDPQVRLGYMHDSLLVSGDQGNTLSVGLTFPLPLFDRGQHDEARALARATELERTTETALRQASAELEELLVRRVHLEQAVESLERSAIPKSESIVATTRRAFDQGQVSLTDLLVTRRTHIGLLLTLLDLKFDRFTVRSELRRTLGLDALTTAGKP